MASLGLDLSRNLSYFTVPAAFVLALAPHSYSLVLGGQKNFDNGHPRTHQDKIQQDQSIDSRTKARIARAKAASTNQFETLGFFAGAVIAANQAGVPARELNYLSLGYLAVRLVYIYAYVELSSTQSGATARSLIWILSMGLSSALYIKAGLRAMSNSLF